MFSEPNKSMLPSNTRKTALIFRISILKTSKKHKHIQLHLHPSYLKVKDKIVVFLNFSEISTNFKCEHCNSKFAVNVTLKVTICSMSRLSVNLGHIIGLAFTFSESAAQYFKITHVKMDIFQCTHDTFKGHMVVPS